MGFFCLLIWIIRRSLVMVAKCLQNLANLVEFGGKEPYMEVVNPFILKNKERMVVFLDQLSVSLLYIFILILYFYILLFIYSFDIASSIKISTLMQ